MQTLTQLGKIAGIGGIALGILLIIFRNVLRQTIFPMLSPGDGYKIIRLILILTFSIAAMGLIVYVTTIRDPVGPPSVQPKDTIKEHKLPFADSIIHSQKT